MKFNNQIFPQSMSCDSEGKLSIETIPISKIAKTFGTPVMVYSAQDVIDETKKFIDVFDRVLFASKAAPIVALEKMIFELGAGCDVASLGELEVAITAGCDPEKMVMHGNNKSDEEIKRCIEIGVGRIVIEDEYECDRIEKIAAEVGVSNVDVELRLTPGIEAHTHEAIMTGAIDSKFGSTIEFGTAKEMVDRIVKSAVLNLQGFHCHIGSQIFDPEPLAQAAKVITEFYIELKKDYSLQDIELSINEINVGGGFGIHYEEQDDPPATIEMAKSVKNAVHEICSANSIDDLEVWVEPGRALVGQAGVTIYEVGSVKVIPGIRNYIAVDGGMSDNLRPAIYGAKHACWIDSRNGADGETVYTVAGKHCEEGDRLATDVSLPSDTASKDLLVQASTGAYSWAMSSNYNMLYRPSVVLVEDGQSREIVRRETAEELLSRHL